MAGYPDGKQFAFSIVDDTDNATVSNVKPIYDFLTKLGVRATKTVWAFPPRDSYRGQSLLDAEYAEFIRELIADGHEIALHNVGSGSFTRDDLVRGMDIFASTLGFYPSLHTNHVSNPDNLYWQPKTRFRAPIGALYAIARAAMSRFAGRVHQTTSGEDPDGPHFWGDLSLQHIRYVRNLTFPRLNILAVDPRMPYHDPRKPMVQYWFSSSDGHTVDHFCDLISPANIQALRAARGASIVYTHFTDGFLTHGTVDARWRAAMEILADGPGWFVPASTLLDHLRANQAGAVSESYLRALDVRWSIERIYSYFRYHR